MIGEPIAERVTQSEAYLQHGCQGGPPLVPEPVGGSGLAWPLGLVAGRWVTRPSGAGDLFAVACTDVGERCYLQKQAAAIQVPKIVPGSCGGKVGHKKGVMLTPQLEVGRSFVEAKIVLLKEGPRGFNP